MATPFLKKAGMFDNDPEETGFGQLFKKKMPPPVPTGDVGVDPLQAGVPQNAMSFDGGGSSTPMGMSSMGAPKPKSSFLDKLGSLFGGGGNQEPERDEYGIAKPHAQRHSTLNNVLSVALPAIYGLTQDVGILPGLMAGLSNISSTKKDELEADTKRYQTERQAKEIGLRPTNLQKDYQAYVAQETAAGRQPKSLFEYQLANKQAGAMQANPWDVYKFNEEMNFKKSEAERRSEESKAKDAEHLALKRASDQDKAIERLAAKLGNSQDAINTLSDINSMLGFDLDDYDPRTQAANGKKIDLPGASIPGLGRVSFYSSDARRLDNTMSKLFNLEIKDRSGAAVTSNEMERLKAEYSSGMFNTEAEKIEALQRYKKALYTAMQNREAGFRPEDVAEYENRGGVTSKRLTRNPSVSRPAPQAAHAPSARPSTGGGMSDDELANIPVEDIDAEIARQKALLKRSPK